MTRLDSATPTSTRPVAARAVSGVIAAGLVLGVGELLAAVFGPESAPFLAVGNAVVDGSPEPMRDFAIDTFGTADKIALFIGMGVIIAVIAAVAGVIERRRRPLGSAVFVILGAIGVWAALDRSDSGVGAAVPTVIGVAAGVVVLRTLTQRAEDTGSADEGVDRRRFMVFAGITAGAAAVSALAGRVLGSSTRAVSDDRSAFTVPVPDSPAPPVPATADLGITGVEPYVTPNDDFYRIDTALVVPRISSQEWSLRIHGMVDQEITLTMDDLLARRSVERMVTLTCVSNPIGGDLIGNAMWTGYPLRELLEMAGPQANADMVLSTSSDGFTAGTPLEVLLDGRDAILAVAMNGEPLPIEHGYPARMVVPGLYGYVSATKWVTDIEITKFSQARAYWTDRGWSERGPVKTACRIDTPTGARDVNPGEIMIAGVAWAQHRGISGVEVRIDDGPWTEATLSEEYSRDTWRQWVLPWTGTSGRHSVEARAIDGTGEVQTADRADTVPDGATGYASTTIIVS